MALTLAGPGEVASVNTESTVLGVATTGADRADTLVSDLEGGGQWSEVGRRKRCFEGSFLALTHLGVGGLATELELAVHAPFGELATGLAALVERVTRDTLQAK